MKKEFISPLLTLAAMLLIIITKFLEKEAFNWITSMAFILILASVYNIWSIYKKSK